MVNVTGNPRGTESESGQLRWPDPVAVLIAHNRAVLGTLNCTPLRDPQFNQLMQRTRQLDTEIAGMRSPTMRGLVARLEWAIEMLQDQDVDFPLSVIEDALADAKALSVN